MFNEISNKLQQMDTKLGLLFKDVKDTNQENKTMIAKMEKHESRIEYLKRGIRNKNLLIKGITDVEKENVLITRENIGNVLQQMEIALHMKAGRRTDEIRRVGKYNNKQEDDQYRNNGSRKLHSL